MTFKSFDPLISKKSSSIKLFLTVRISFVKNCKLKSLIIVNFNNDEGYQRKINNYDNMPQGKRKKRPSLVEEIFPPASQYIPGY